MYVLLKTDVKIQKAFMSIELWICTCAFYLFIFFIIYMYLTNRKFKHLEFCSFVHFCSAMSEKREGRGQMRERRKGRNCTKKCLQTSFGRFN